jgi:hypothetical protein
VTVVGSNGKTLGSGDCTATAKRKLSGSTAAATLSDVPDLVHYTQDEALHKAAVCAARKALRLK